MSRRDNGYGNAVVERCFAMLELDLIAGADWATRTAARSAVFE